MWEPLSSAARVAGRVARLAAEDSGSHPQLGFPQKHFSTLCQQVQYSLYEEALRCGETTVATASGEGILMIEDARLDSGAQTDNDPTAAG
jgi:hypothetical protein